MADEDTKVLKATDWINILWIVSRITLILEHAPASPALNETELPLVIWSHNDDFFAMLDFDEGEMTLHISENLPEALALPIIGACAVRAVKWEFIEDPQSEIEIQGPVITSFMVR